MRKIIIAGLLGGITGMALASGGISIYTWEFWVVQACLLGMFLNLTF